MTLLILKLSSMIGRLSVQSMSLEERETILREIQNLIEDYFSGTEKKN